MKLIKNKIFDGFLALTLGIVGTNYQKLNAQEIDIYTPVFLKWNRSPNTEGSKIYIGESEGKYDRVIDVKRNESYCVNLKEGITNYIALTSYNSKIESELSSKMTYFHNNFINIETNINGDLVDYNFTYIQPKSNTGPYAIYYNTNSTKLKNLELDCDWFPAIKSSENKTELSDGSVIVSDDIIVPLQKKIRFYFMPLPDRPTELRTVFSP